MKPCIKCGKDAHAVVYLCKEHVEEIKNEGIRIRKMEEEKK